jgi:hypothetical protein
MGTLLGIGVWEPLSFIHMLAGVGLLSPAITAGLLLLLFIYLFLAAL